MTSEEHLHTSDILAFRERRLSGAERSQTAAHLIRCEDCRDRLPKPTANEFWRAVMGSDNEECLETNTISTSWTSLRGYIAALTISRLVFRNAIFPGILLLALLSFSVFLMMPPSGSPVNENLIAAVGDTKPQDMVQPLNYDDPGGEHVVGAVPQPSQGSSSRPITDTPEKSPARRIPAPERRISRQPKSLRTDALGIRKQADTRGNTLCGGQRFVALGVKLTDEGLQLTWDKVKGAMKYDVYLSDLDERLISHFETADQTSYLVTTKLAPEKVHRLRLIASLENGERIVSESQNFTINDLKNGPRSFSGNGGRKKTAASVRCVEVKQ